MFTLNYSTYKKVTDISAAYVLYNNDSFNTIIRKDVFRFINKIVNSSNILIQAISESFFYTTCSSITKKWNNILYTFNMR